MRVVIVRSKQEAQVLPPLIAPLFIPNKLPTCSTRIQWISTDELPAVALSSFRFIDKETPCLSRCIAEINFDLN